MARAMLHGGGHISGRRTNRSDFYARPLAAGNTAARAQAR